MANLALHFDQSKVDLAANLRRVFSGVAEISNQILKIKLQN